MVGELYRFFRCTEGHGDRYGPENLDIGYRRRRLCIHKQRGGIEAAGRGKLAIGLPQRTAFRHTLLDEVLNAGELDGIDNCAHIN